MNSTDKIKEKVRHLSSALDDSVRKISIRDECFPTAVAIGSTVPFLTMFSLFVFKPRFVMKREGNRSIRDTKRIFWWTIGLTILIWAGMWVFNYYKGFDKLAMTCMIHPL